MIGALVGNYKVHSQIGAGGMGEVYLAEHTTIGTRVAIKVLMAGISKDQEQVDRFFNEARAVNKVRHAGPVKIFDVGYYADANGNKHAYLVMEFLDGESLASRIKRLGSLPGDQVADIGRQIAGVLDAVHSAGITHRDLKPDNIFLIPDHELPSGERVKVLDFGIAKLTGTMSGGGPQTKGTMGTPAYMAPEQWNNAAMVDGRADTYSLGCVMFEMAVGKPPFPSQSIGEACNHHLNSKPPRASDIHRNVPPEFDSLVDRMLSKQSDQRPTIKEVSRAFDELRHSGATSRWTAAMVTGVAQTMGPDTPAPWQPPAHGSQPNLHPGSQPNLNPGSQPNLNPGSQPNMPSGGGMHLGHTPGMQNPFAGNPSQQYQAQGGSQPFIPQQGGSQPFIPSQQNTPQPGQHFTPQHGHSTPQHTTPIPGHQTGPGYITQNPPPGTIPPQPKSKKGLVFALVGIAVVGGGAAIAVTQLGGKGTGDGSDQPGSGTNVIGSNDLKTPADGPEKATIDAPTKQPVIDAPGPSLRDQILAKNPFVNRYGVRVLSTQINAREWELVMGAKPPVALGKDEPVHSMTQVEATEFCTKIGARLPSSDEWTQAAKGAWGIAVGPVAGPLQEWTSTIQDELAVARGGHEKMDQASLDKHARSKPPYFLQKEQGGPGVERKVASSPTIGFRCVDAPPVAPKTGAVDPKPSDAKPAPDAKPDLTLPALPGGTLAEKLTRTWAHSSTTKVDGKTITLATSMKLVATGSAVTGTSTTFASIGLSNYSSVVNIVGKPATANSFDFTSKEVRADPLPNGLGWCPSHGRLKVAEDPRRKGHYRLSGTLRLTGSCAGQTEYYAYLSK